MAAATDVMDGTSRESGANYDAGNSARSNRRQAADFGCVYLAGADGTGAGVDVVIIIGANLLW